MADVEADTHAQAVAGAASTAAGDTIVSGAAITLPAGGPWKIFQVWCQVAAATATAADGFGGHFRLNASSGDLEPNPAPSRFPTGQGGSFLGATNDQRMNPLNLIDVEYEAAGKAVIEFIYNEATAQTVANQVVGGIIFGKTRPVNEPIRFIDRVRAQQTAVADTLLGTITISEKATQITHVGCTIAQDNVITAGEELLGYFRLDSDDMDLAPAQYPCSAAFSAGLGALISQTQFCVPKLIPVIMPVIGGARVNCYIKLNTAVTNAAEVEIFVAYK